MYTPKDLNISESIVHKTVKISAYTAEIEHKNETTFTFCTNLPQVVQQYNESISHVSPSNTPRFSLMVKTSMDVAAFLLKHDEVQCIVATFEAVQQSITSNSLCGAANNLVAFLPSDNNN